ncbi:HAL protein kinase [Penicillium riverlandense]|uniref:HAL protein kinase n=1 Tax=Penicillium riverlandense TaxID=1903569 RepID=UPI0025481BBF|nr:HAL protein kinase [Penicillium riverlandense]KAJ5826455.1 HAL protein kinase [Penicillium riverlandense]
MEPTSSTKKIGTPTYAEAEHIWQESEGVWRIAQTEDQFNNAQNAAGTLTITDLDTNRKTQGGYGKVYGAEVQYKNSRQLKGVVKEVRGRIGVDGALLMKSINSEYVAKAKGVFWAPMGQTSIVMMDKLDFNLEEELTIVADNPRNYEGQAFTDRTIAPIQQSFRAVRDTHFAGVAHLDIKPENVMSWNLCSDPGKGKYRLIDFDHSIDVAKTSTLPSFGSDLYKAPEIANGEPYRPYVADTYSFAWMHYDTINPQLLLTPAGRLRRQNLVDMTYRDSPPNDLEMGRELTAALTMMGMTSQNSPMAFNEARLIAQALQPEAKRIKFSEYYQKWCEVKKTDCPDIGNEAWQAEGNNQGAK